MSKCHIVGNHMSRLILCMLVCFIISESIHKCHSSIDSEEVRLEILDTAGLVNSFSFSLSINIFSLVATFVVLVSYVNNQIGPISHW